NGEMGVSALALCCNDRSYYLLNAQTMLWLMKKYFKYLILSISLIAVTAPVQTIQAQCPMCKMSAESNLKSGGSAGKGLNKGILYMLTMPYIMVATLGFIWYRNRKREDEIEITQKDIDPLLN
ncbi:MAG: hypothetical protein AAGK97_13340, partial [Bacteroidota bacterium]